MKCRKLLLPWGFGIGTGPLTVAPVAWWKWYRYAIFMSYGDETRQAWHVRVLWFYFGRMTWKK